MGRQGSSSEFRADRARSELGMRQIKVVLALHDVIAKFVAESEAEPMRTSICSDNVETNQLWLLTAVKSVARPTQSTARRDQDMTVTLVEPLRLRTWLAILRAAAFQADLEQAHRIRQLGFLGVDLSMHRIARLRAAKMSEAGTGH